MAHLKIEWDRKKVKAAILDTFRDVLGFAPAASKIHFLSSVHYFVLTPGDGRTLYFSINFVSADGFDPTDFVFCIDLYREVGWGTGESEQFYIGRSWSGYDLRKGVE